MFHPDVRTHTLVLRSTNPMHSRHPVPPGRKRAPEIPDPKEATPSRVIRGLAKIAQASYQADG